MNDVVEFLDTLAYEIGCVGDGVCQLGADLRREIEILDGVLVDDGINLDNGGVDTVSVKSCWGRAYSQPTICSSQKVS